MSRRFGTTMLLAAVVLLASLAITACGQATDVPPTTAPAAVPTDAAPVEKPFEGVTINMLSASDWWSKGYLEFTYPDKTLLQEFEEQTGAKITYDVIRYLCVD